MVRLWFGWKPRPWGGKHAESDLELSLESMVRTPLDGDRHSDQKTLNEQKTECE